MKAKKSFYWQGKLINAGDEAPKGVPKHLVEGEVQKDHQNVSRKVSTKRARKPKEDKNAKPKQEDK